MVEGKASDAIVLDNGSATIKAGFAGSDLPRCTFPTIIHKSSKDEKLKEIGKDQAEVKIKDISVQYPIEDGKITNWDNMNEIWNYTFTDQLRINPKDYKILLTESPFSPKSDREKSTQMMFETYSTPALYLALSSVLGLYSYGVTTGLMVDCGHCACYTVPVLEGYAITPGIRKLPIGGKHLTKYLETLLTSQVGRDYDFSSRESKLILTAIKEKLCYVALDFKDEVSKAEQSAMMERGGYELPDGQMIDIKDERFRCPEPLFQPKLLGEESKGIHQLVFESILAEEFFEYTPFGKIMLCGGTSLFEGFPERLSAEVQLLTPCKVKVTPNNERENTTWIGGSIFASLQAIQQLWITKQEYDECGASIVHRRCF